MTRPPQPVLCIDFGFDRMAILEVTGDQVTGWAIKDLPPRLVRNGDPVEPGQIAALINEMRRQNRLTGVRARITLPDEAAVFRVVELPAMPRRHLRRALAYVVEKEVPLPFDRIRWDWDVLDRTDIGYRICVVAAWGDVIERVQQVADMAGLDLELVEPRSLAIARSLDRDRVVIFDGSRDRLQVLVLTRGAIPFVEQASMAADPKTCASTLERLLRRGSVGELETVEKSAVVMSGELEEVTLPLSLTTAPASRSLNGHPPRRTDEMPSGMLLANIGMAMRGSVQ